MTREHDHSVCEDPAEKTSVIKVRKPVRCVLEVEAEISAPTLFVAYRGAVVALLLSQRVCEEVGGLKRIIDALAGDRISETSRISDERPSIAGRPQISPTRKIEGGNLRSKESNTFGVRHAAVIMRADKIREQAP